MGNLTELGPTAPRIRPSASVVSPVTHCSCALPQSSGNECPYLHIFRKMYCIFKVNISAHAWCLGLAVAQMPTCRHAAWEAAPRHSHPQGYGGAGRAIGLTGATPRSQHRQAGGCAVTPWAPSPSSAVCPMKNRSDKYVHVFPMFLTFRVLRASLARLALRVPRATSRLPLGTSWGTTMRACQTPSPSSQKTRRLLTTKTRRTLASTPPSSPSAARSRPCAAPTAPRSTRPAPATT